MRSVEMLEIAGEADRDYEARIEAERCTLELATASHRRLDAGHEPMNESPLFGGAAQGELFGILK